MQHVLGSQLPFGGKQVIFLGDFHQLPPVKPFEFCLYCGDPMRKEMMADRLVTFCPDGCKPPAKYTNGPVKSQDDKIIYEMGDKWAFKAPVWAQLKLRHVKLEQYVVISPPQPPLFL